MSEGWHGGSAGGVVVVLRGSVRVLRGRRLGAAGDVLCVEKAVHTDERRGRRVARHDGRCVRKSSHSGRFGNAVGGFGGVVVVVV